MSDVQNTDPRREAYNDGRWCGECNYGVVENPPCCTPVPVSPATTDRKTILDRMDRDGQLAELITKLRDVNDHPEEEHGTFVLIELAAQALAQAAADLKEARSQAKRLPRRALNKAERERDELQARIAHIRAEAWDEGYCAVPAEPEEREWFVEDAPNPYRAPLDGSSDQ